MKQFFALLGHPVSHSISPAMHSAAFLELGLDAGYLLLDVTPENLKNAINGARALGFRGLNLTIPHKEAALDIVEPDELAASIGAINTIDLKSMTGHNTDGTGFLRAMKAQGLDPDGLKVLLLGAGGAARAISHTLAESGARLVIANRDAARSRRLAAGVLNATARSLEGLVEIARESDVIINATPVGMHPHAESTLLTREAFRPGQAVFDTIYNPAETRLLAEARTAGAAAFNGVGMLVHQGAESLRIWLGVEPPVLVMEAAALDAMTVMSGDEEGRR